MVKYRRCHKCQKVIKGYKPYSKAVKGKIYYYCASHSPGFYFKCPYCKEVLFSKKAEEKRHLLVIAAPDRGVIMCPKFIEKTGKYGTIRIKRFERVERNDRAKEY